MANGSVPLKRTVNDPQSMQILSDTFYDAFISQSSKRRIEDPSQYTSVPHRHPR